MSFAKVDYKKICCVDRSTQINEPVKEVSSKASPFSRKSDLFSLLQDFILYHVLTHGLLAIVIPRLYNVRFTVFPVGKTNPFQGYLHLCLFTEFLPTFSVYDVGQNRNAKCTCGFVFVVREKKVQLFAQERM